MHRADGTNKDDDLFGTGKDGFTDGTAAAGDGTYLTASQLNHVQEEIIRALRKSGILPDGTKVDMYQLVEALAEMTRLRGATSSEGVLDCVVSGLGHTTGSGSATLQPGVAYINGSRVNVSTAVLTDEGDHDSFSLTDGNDTYFQLNDEGDRNYAEVSHGAAAPTPAAGFVNVSYLWNNGGAVTETKLLPQKLSLGIGAASRLGNWIPLTISTMGSTVNGLIWSDDDSVFVAALNDGSIFTTPNGWDWTDLGDFGSNLRGVDYDGTNYVVVGVYDAATDCELFTSSDAVTFTERSNPAGSGDDLYDVSGSGSRWAAVGLGGFIMTTGSDPTTGWTSQTSGTTENLGGVHDDGTTIVAVGDNGTIRYSTNGTTWSGATSGTTEDLNGVTKWDGKWYAVGTAGTLISASDPTGTWSAETSGTSNDLLAIGYRGGDIVAVGSSVILTSTDGSTWGSRPVGSATLSAVAGNDERFIVQFDATTILRTLEAA